MPTIILGITIAIILTLSFGGSDEGRIAISVRLSLCGCRQDIVGTINNITMKIFHCLTCVQKR